MEKHMSAYKDALTDAMTELSVDPLTRFIGYGVRCPGRGGGTFKGVPLEQCIETPVAENLMVGLACGLALKGYKPLVYIERCDFLLNALDAIVNHLDSMAEISRGQFNPTVIFRIVVGNRSKPLYTGPTHCRDFSDPLAQMVNFPVCSLGSDVQVLPRYREAHKAFGNESTALFEYKDLL